MRLSLVDDKERSSKLASKDLTGLLEYNCPTLYGRLGEESGLRLQFKHRESGKHRMQAKRISSLLETVSDTWKWGGDGQEGTQKWLSHWPPQ